jgi:hypothetical protein
VTQAGLFAQLAQLSQGQPEQNRCSFFVNLFSNRFNGQKNHA